VSETLGYGDDGTEAPARGGSVKPERSRAEFKAHAATHADKTDSGEGSGGGINGLPSLEWTRQTLLSDDERARARKVHLLFVSAGVFMLVFLALAFVYFVWIDTPPRGGSTPTPAPSAAGVEAPAVTPAPRDAVDAAASAPTPRSRRRSARRRRRKRRR
jgi:hypothetical protein